MLGQLENDMICFHQRCISNSTQLFYQADPANDFHIRQNHPYTIIDHRQPHFQKLKDKRVTFKYPKQTLLQNINKQYSEIKSRINYQLQNTKMRCINIIDELYRIENRALELNIYKQQLTKETIFTSLYLHILNQSTSNSNIGQYIGCLPSLYWEKTLWSFQQALKSLQNIDFFRKCKKQILKVPHLPIQFPVSIMKIDELKHQRFGIQKQQKLEAERLTRKKNPQLILQVCHQLIKSRKLCFRDLKPQIKQQFNLQRKHKTFDKYFHYIVRKVFNEIERQIIQQFNSSKIVKISCNHKERMYVDLKEYKSWMSLTQKEIFQKCIRFVHNIGEKSVITEQEIYVIYTKLVIQIIEKNQSKNIELYYNTEPINLHKEIFYLYWQYSNFQKVSQVLKQRYVFCTHVKENFQLEVRRAISLAYGKLDKIYQLESSQSLLNLLQKITNFQIISEICELIAQFQIFEHLSKEQLLRLNCLIANATASIITKDQGQSQLQVHFCSKIANNSQNISVMSEVDEERKQRKIELMKQKQIVKFQEFSDSELSQEKQKNFYSDIEE